MLLFIHMNCMEYVVGGRNSMLGWHQSVWLQLVPEFAGNNEYFIIRMRMLSPTRCWNIWKWIFMDLNALCDNFEHIQQMFPSRIQSIRAHCGGVKCSEQLANHVVCTSSKHAERPKYRGPTLTYSVFEPISNRVMGFSGSCKFKSKNLECKSACFFRFYLECWCDSIWTFKQAILTINHKWWIWIRGRIYACAICERERVCVDAVLVRMMVRARWSYLLLLEFALALYFCTGCNWKLRDYMFAGSIKCSLSHLHNAINSFGITVVLVWWVFVCIGACWGFCGWHESMNCDALNSSPFALFLSLSHCVHAFPYLCVHISWACECFTYKMDTNVSIYSVLIRTQKYHRPHHMHTLTHKHITYDTRDSEVITAHCSLDQHSRAIRFMLNGLPPPQYIILWQCLSPLLIRNILNWK